MIETIEAPAPFEPTTKPKPSELLRLGRLLHPQVFGPLTKVGPDGEICGTCAVGAILVAAGVEFKEGTWPSLASSAYGAITELMVAVRVTPPCEHAEEWNVWGVTVHLNDQHHWPTEQIAIWLEGLGL